MSWPGDVVADADLAQADDAVEGRDERRLVERRLGQREAASSARSFASAWSRARCVPAPCVDRARRRARGWPAERQAAFACSSCARAMAASSVNRGALAELLPFLEQDLGDAAGDLRPDDHRFVGAQAADRLDLPAHGGQLHRRRFDGDRRVRAGRRVHRDGGPRAAAYP